MQSKAPMKQIAIKNENGITNSTDVDLADNIKKLVFSRTPKNYNEFEFDWRTLSALGIADKLEYLEMISLTSWENIFKFPFEPKILLEVLQTLSHSKNLLFAFQVLQIITKMPRFNLSVSFFDEDEFQGTPLLIASVSQFLVIYFIYSSRYYFPEYFVWRTRKRTSLGNGRKV